MSDFSDEFSEISFWEKVKNFAKAAGKEVIEKALMLYCCFLDRDTPAWAKTVIIGTLGYFIMPLDAIPDLTLAVGYADDLGALTVAVAMVAAHIKPEHRVEAEEKLRVWFGQLSLDRGVRSGSRVGIPHI